MKRFRNYVLFVMLAIVGVLAQSCGSDSDDSPLDFSDVVGTFEIKEISGTNTHSWLTTGDRMTFKANGTCVTGFIMENSWTNEGGVIKTYYKQTKEPMFVYTLKSRNNGVYTVHMQGTLDDNTSLTLILQKVDETATNTKVSTKPSSEV